MQYLLTEEEYKALRPAAEVVERDEAIEAMRKLVLEKAGFTCIHDLTERSYGICDPCPLSFVSLKNSGHANHHKLSNQMCNLYQRYSK